TSTGSNVSPDQTAETFEPVEVAAEGELSSSPSDAIGTSMRKQLTAIPSGCSSRAASTVKCSKAALVIPYTDTPGIGTTDATDDTLRIAPPPTARMWCATSRVAMN